MRLLAAMLGLLAMLVNADVLETSLGSVNTCAGHSIQDPVQFPYLPPLLPFVVRCVILLFYMFVCFFGVALN